MECKSKERGQRLGSHVGSLRTQSADASQVACAVERALQDPFDCLFSDEPILSQGNTSGTGWEWAVFSSSPPGWCEERMLKALRKKVRAARAAEEQHSRNGCSISTEDLLKTSGDWPRTDTCFEREFGGSTYSYIHIRLLLISRDAIVGFCTLKVNMSLENANAIPYLRVDVESAFIEPAWRGQGLSRLLVEATTIVATRVFSEFGARLRVQGVQDELGVALLVCGDVISIAGGRFLDALGKQMWMTTRQKSITVPDSRSALRIVKMRVLDEHQEDPDECW